MINKHVGPTRDQVTAVSSTFTASGWLCKYKLEIAIGSRSREVTLRRDCGHGSNSATRAHRSPSEGLNIACLSPNTQNVNRGITHTDSSKVAELFRSFESRSTRHNGSPLV